MQLQASLPACPMEGVPLSGKQRKETWDGNKLNPEPNFPPERPKAITMQEAHPRLSLVCLRQFGLAVCADGGEYSFAR